MLRPSPLRSMCCCRYLFFVVFHSFWPRNGHREIQPQEMNVCDLGFGQLVSGIFKGLVSHCVRKPHWLKAVSAQTSLISCHNCDWGDNLVFFDPIVFVTFVILVS